MSGPLRSEDITVLLVAPKTPVAAPRGRCKQIDVLEALLPISCWMLVSILNPMNASLSQRSNLTGPLSRSECEALV